MSPRIGAYVLTGDTTWLGRSLGSYYPLLTALVIPWPEDGLGWHGQDLPLAAIGSIVESIDDRHLLRLVPGRWTDRDHPLDAETRQRQAAIDALSDEVDWILQIDNDEVLPDPDRLLRVLTYAESRGLAAVEWPSRTLFRRTRRSVLQVATASGEPNYEYPGPIAVRPRTRLVSARRVDAAFLRPVVEGDDASLQVARPADAAEDRSSPSRPTRRSSTPVGLARRGRRGRSSPAGGMPPACEDRSTSPWCGGPHPSPGDCCATSTRSPARCGPG
ncbi:hypothetical protein [Branchiibius cervicis]|uniref:Glycosyltransferase family 2 protein n=1 Tax=Branchiibius cervicis TaxID=908252 RepID=A0ABW2AW32_9MICO